MALTRSIALKSATGMLTALMLSLLPRLTSADIAVIVHPQNPTATLTENDVRRIFMGRLRLFPDTNIGIDAIDVSDASQVFLEFYAAVARISPEKLKRQRASYLFSGNGRLPQVLVSETAVHKHVANSLTAIGYISAQNVDESVKVICIIEQ